MYCCFKPVRLASSLWVRLAWSRARLRFQPKIADVRLRKLTSKLGTKIMLSLAIGASGGQVVRYELSIHSLLNCKQRKPE
jgi:hypothetical protein